VTVTATEPPAPDHAAPEATGLLGWLTSTDHKKIGVSYMVTAFGFFMVGGALAEVIRAQLWSPDSHLVSASTYDQAFTMHGSIMMYLFIVPFAFGLANYIVPLQLGAKEMAFPRLNALGYWLYLFGGLTMVSGFLTADGAADFGWTAYVPLSNSVHSPSVGADLWLVAIVLTGLAGVLASVNIVATVSVMRAPGMSMFRMPIFTWNMLVTSVLVLIAFPVLTSASCMLLADRLLGGHIFDPAGGGVPILWQHLFWFFGHPEVYVAALPYFGVVTEILPVFSRRPVFGYIGLVFATLFIAAYSVGVWAHHMFATGAVEVTFFSGLSFLIAVPTGVKFFNWIGTMWGGSIVFATPMLFAVGFLSLFLLGGLTGVLLASVPVDLQLTDSYFVVAHMHYVLFGGSAFALFAAIYYWYPKFTGTRLHEGWGKLHFAVMFIGFNLTFAVQHELGLKGMPRRIATYRAADGFTTLNRISTVGAALLGVSTFPFLWNVYRTWRRGEPAGDNPWDGHTLEWATTSPPPPHNFDTLPPIHSNRPMWDLNHPDHPAS
jgi:cytochrome c oxidase subunit 1